MKEIIAACLFYCKPVLALSGLVDKPDVLIREVLYYLELISTPLLIIGTIDSVLGVCNFPPSFQVHWV